MAFRADEASKSGLDRVRSFLISNNFNASDRTRSENNLQNIIDKYGPVVDSYPTWHPLVSNNDSRMPSTIPNKECGYKGLDHTRYFRNGFISCPYGDGQEIIDSVKKLPCNPFAEITAKRLDVKFYHIKTTPILVCCNWHKPLDLNGMIPAALAVPLMLKKELSCCEWSEVAETWERMRFYFLGSPFGSRSSLFVSPETGMKMKKIHDLLIYTGMFGHIAVSN